ncbi:ion transporter [Membranicola marinus]|uniref:Ion transporter n=1 Tax=Membranihabitans marinus TaxID=1227546 RepID=A0A953L8H4_9BACT|nr:ion transporter [Membranihabitans marinus]MBY5957690.1 ion transporter [Membranihabitans marinus]
MNFKADSDTSIRDDQIIRFLGSLDVLINFLIFLNLIALSIETFKGVPTHVEQVLRHFEIFSIIVFSVEYITRIILSPITHPSKSKVGSYAKYIFSIFGIIDLLSIIPFYLPLVFSSVDLRFIRVLRFLRFFRIFKLGRYYKSMKLVREVLQEKKSELVVTGFLSIIIILFSAFLMYFVEGQVQPDEFSNVLDGIWWAIATLTTVGYGDVYPITGVGKFVSGIIAVTGIGLIALPTALISAGFMDKMKGEDASIINCPHCGKKVK